MHVSTFEWLASTNKNHLESTDNCHSLLAVRITRIVRLAQSTAIEVNGSMSLQSGKLSTAVLCGSVLPVHRSVHESSTASTFQQQRASGNLMFDEKSNILVCINLWIVSICFH